MSVNLQNVLSKSGGKMEDNREKQVSKGFIPNHTSAGVQVIGLYDEFGHLTKPGSFQTFGDTTVRSANSQYRLVDDSTFDDDLKKVKANNQYVTDLINMLLESQGNELAFKYLGAWANLLDGTQDGTEKQTKFRNYAESVGVILTANSGGVLTANASPAFLSVADRRNENFSNGINRLRLIIKMSGLVFNRRKQHRVDGGIAQGTNSIQEGDAKGYSADGVLFTPPAREGTVDMTKGGTPVTE